MHPTTTKENIKEVFEVIFYFAITLRLEIERKKELSNQRPEVILYLESGDMPVDKLIDEKIIKKLNSE